MKNTLQIFNYSVKNQNNNDNVLDVHIDGTIVDAETLQIYQDWWGDETSVSFKSIRDEISNSGKKKINFWVNSFGGHVGDAMAIHDWIVQLESQGYEITTNCVGMACSAATYIVSASKNSNISKNSFYMIHNVSGGIWGDVNTIENYAKTMRKFNDVITNYYADLTGKTTKQVTDWMNAETWFTGSEAVEFRFVKNLLENQNFTNKINNDLFPYKNTGALNLYNSFVKAPANTDEEDFNFKNVDMNKFFELFVNAMKDAGFIANTENPDVKPKPLTADALTNALTEAFKDFQPEAPTQESIDNAVVNFFKDGLPTNITTQLGEIVTNSTKGFVTNETFLALEQELEQVKEDMVNGAGQAKTKEKDNEKIDATNHEGVTFGGK